MQNITKNITKSNMTGNRHISIAATDEIKEVRLSAYNTKSVVFNLYQSFGKIEADEIQFSCREEEGCFVHEISCRMVSVQGRHDALFNRMKHKRWIVRIIDNNNMSWLAGSLSEPLRFRWEHTGEDKASGQHSYILFFERNSSEPLFATDVYYKIDVVSSEEVSCEHWADA